MTEISSELVESEKHDLLTLSLILPGRIPSGGKYNIWFSEILNNSDSFRSRGKLMVHLKENDLQ